MTPEVNKLKSLYKQLDQQQAAGEDVVADLKKEINNLELAYLKEQVLPQVAQFMASKVRGLRCEIDSSFQFDGDNSINYSFCTSGSMLFVKDKIEVNTKADFTEIIFPKPKVVVKSIINTVSEINTGSDSSEPNKSLCIVDYSEKAVAVYGDTKSFSTELKKIGGYFNPNLRGGMGWVFSKKKVPELKELLGPYLKNEKTPDYNNQSNVNLFSDIDSEDESFLSEEEWIKMLLSMRGSQIRRLTSPHKAIFILAIIDSIKLGHITENRIYATTKLSDIFIKIWNKYVPADWPFQANVFQPYVHLNSEPFYFLVNADGINDFDINQSWYRNLVNRYVNYTYLDSQLFKLLHEQSFTEKLSKCLIDKFINQQLDSIISKKNCEQPIHDINAFAGYKDYLSTLTSNIGKPYSQSSINVYSSALRSEYMQTKVSKVTGIHDLEMISDLSIIDELINEVKYDAEHGKINKIPYVALKMFRDYRECNPIVSQSKSQINPTIKIIPISKDQRAPEGKPLDILSINAEYIHIKKGNLRYMVKTFLNEIGPELVYDLKIKYMGGNLIDLIKNPSNKESCVKLMGGYWANISDNPQVIANQINKICEYLDMDVSITMKYEDFPDGYTIESKPRKMYSLNGGQPLNKRQVVLEVVRLYVKTHPEATFKQLESIFPKELHGRYGVITPISIVHKRIENGFDDKHRYFLEDNNIFHSSDKIAFVVCNKWGHRFSIFQNYIQNRFNWSIKEI